MWLPGVERIQGNSAGAMDGDGSKKFLLHTTEGTSIQGAVGAYTANNSWPHFTVDCGRRQIVQHLDTAVAARSLRNESGGVETNRDGNCNVQVEMVGFAGNPSTVGSPADLAWFGEQVVGPIARHHKIPLVTTVRWVAYPESYGTGASQRLSPSEWDTYNGLLGHQHAPENSHGDPGALDVAAIIAGAQGEDEDLNQTQADQLANIDTWINVLKFAIDMEGQATKWKGNLPGRVDAIYDTKLPEIMAKLDELSAKVDALAPPVEPPTV
jgi:hypothetical protein